MTEICALLGFYAAQTGSLLPTLRTTYWPIFLMGQAVQEEFKKLKTVKHNLLYSCC